MPLNQLIRAQGISRSTFPSSPGAHSTVPHTKLQLKHTKQQRHGVKPRQPLGRKLFSNSKEMRHVLSSNAENLSSNIKIHTLSS